MFSFLWALIVGGIIGAIAGAILGKDVPVALLEILSWAFRKLGSITLVAFFRTSHRRFSNYLSVARSDYLYCYLLFYCKPQGVKLYQNDILKSIIKLVKVDQTITFDVFSLIF